ncbi:hypothetical protein [Chryseobacterium wanjuense]
MKDSILSGLIFLSALIFSFKINAQNKDFNNYYFNDYITFHSLETFINSNQIFIYDEKRQIDTDDLKYEYKDGSILKTIQVLHEIPKIKNYLLLSDYIINDNLAVISFADSNKKKYIIYTFKRKNKDDKRWSLLSIYNGSMN